MNIKLEAKKDIVKKKPPCKPVRKRRLPKLPTGYPLSDLVQAEPFTSWLGLTGSSCRNACETGEKAGARFERNPVPDYLSRMKPPSKKFEQSCLEIPEWTQHVWLERFKSIRIAKGRDAHAYEFLVEFSCDREIPIGLPQPKGTVALVGHDLKEGSHRERMRLRFVQEPRYGRLLELNISGSVRFRLSRGLVRPVVESNSTWIDGPQRFLDLPLGNSKITLRRGEVPKLSAPLVAPDVTVLVSDSDVAIKPGRATIAGTAAFPKLRFVGSKVVHLTS